MAFKKILFSISIICLTTVLNCQQPSDRNSDHRSTAPTYYVSATTESHPMFIHINAVENIDYLEAIETIHNIETIDNIEAIDNTKAIDNTEAIDNIEAIDNTEVIDNFSDGFAIHANSTDTVGKLKHMENPIIVSSSSTSGFGAIVCSGARAAAGRKCSDDDDNLLVTDNNGAVIDHFSRTGKENKQTM